MNDQMNFSELLARLDKACEKMNAGLGAIATVLAALVVFMGVIRASEVAADLGLAANTAALTTQGDNQIPTFGTYY